MRLPTISFILLLLILASCSQPVSQLDWSQKTLPLVPLPKEVALQAGQFDLRSQLSIQAPDNCQFSVAQLREALHPLGISLKLEQGSSTEVEFRLEDSLPNEEAYELSIDPTGILLKARSPQGIFYGVQTLTQLLSIVPKDTLALPAISIKDAPRLGWRGLHLDVARHFFPKEFILRYLDHMAGLKLNTFHWHLTDDQGWRIEIKRYPRLAEVGGFRDSTLMGHIRTQPRRFDGQRYGGYYTQADIREIVAYAQQRFITIVPEIEIPGHAQAAIAAYPALGVTNNSAVRPWTMWGISPYLYNVEDSTFTFLNGILTEVMELFPGPYIHVGGDEAVKGQWEQSPAVAKRMRELGIADVHDLQSYFMSRISEFIHSQGRKMIGWDEIAERALAPGAAVMYWRGWLGDSIAVEVIKRGHPVVMVPTTYAYFDYYQSQDSTEPLAIGGYLPLEKVYSYDPIPSDLSAAEEALILGAQANVWTEYMPTTQQVEYMLFPRVLALAEIVWTPKQTQDFAAFQARIRALRPLLDAREVGYAPHGF